MKKGIDISYWQDDIDFSKVKKDGIEFVILRSSYRKKVDSKFHEYVKGCKANNIPILGVYHFSYAMNETAVIEEAKFCISQVKKAGLSKDTIIFFDFEYDTVQKAANAGVTLTPKECNAHTVAFCDYVKSQGYKAGVYANIDYYKNWYSKDVINKYLFWLADYTGEPDYPCLVHQYSSSGKVNGINGKVDMNHYYEKEIVMPKVRSRQAVVDLVKSWEGKNESDGSHRTIIDIYNSYKGKLPRGIKMEYDWAWCACTWSAQAIELGYTDIMPIEISCGELVANAKKMGCWQERDDYVPKPADAVLYDWDDNGVGDNTGWPDHIGTVIEVDANEGYMIIMEGNLSDSVKRRKLAINGRYIRGFITPKYTDDSVSEAPNAPTPTKSITEVAKEVVDGKWGNGDARKKALESAGYDYNKVQEAVNKLLKGSASSSTATSSGSNSSIKEVKSTCAADKFNKDLAGQYNVTTDLYLRNDAGQDKRVLFLIPKGTKVNCYGYYSIHDNTKWLYIQFTLNGVKYTGFSHSGFLKK